MCANFSAIFRYLGRTTEEIHLVRVYESWCKPLPVLTSYQTAAFSLSSGTIGAAMASSLSKIRSIAISYGVMLHPTPKEFDGPAHRLSGRIINQLLANWGDEEVLYSVNIPLIQGLLEPEGLKIYWTTVWKNHYGRLFKETNITPEVKKETFQGTDATTTTEKATNEEETDRDLVFKFSPDIGGILNASTAPFGSDGWALSEGAVSVTALQPSFAERDINKFRTINDRVWKMKL